MAVIAGLVTACTAIAPTSLAPSADSTILGSPSPSIGQPGSPMSSPSVLALASVAPTESATPSAVPSSDASASPATSGTPPPKPTLDPGKWREIGYTMSVASPIAVGHTASVAVRVVAGPTCSIHVRYPSGTSPGGLGAHTFSKQGSWTWKWTIPTSAGLGTASVNVACTYAGISKPGSGSFRIVEPTPPTPKPSPLPVWGITVDAPASAKAGTPATFHGHVTGHPPVGMYAIDLYCWASGQNPGGDYIDGMGVNVFDVRDFSVDFTFAFAGAGHWRVTCSATGKPTPKRVGGAIDITPP